MAVTEELVREELRKVIDPELFVNIVDLGLVYVIELVSVGSTSDASGETTQDTPPLTDDSVLSERSSDLPSALPEAGTEETSIDRLPHDVVIDMTMTSPACPAGPQLIANSKQVVGRMPGVRNVEVRIVMDPPWTPDRMTDEAKDQLGIF